MTVFGTYQGASDIMRKASGWKRSRISMSELEAVPQRCNPKVQIAVEEDEAKLRPTVSWPFCLGVGLPSGANDQICVFCLTIMSLDMGRPL
jgi:hypothetical protein